MASEETDQLVLGIDPGLNITGYGLVRNGARGPQLCEAGVVRSRRAGSLEAKLMEIRDGVADVLATWKPRVRAVARRMRSGRLGSVSSGIRRRPIARRRGCPRC